MAKEESTFFVPEEIENLAQKFRDARIERDKLTQLQRQEREGKEKTLRAERRKAGLVYAKKVFLWAETFQNSFVGQELMEMSHIPTAYKNIFFFDGHIEGVDWVGLVVTPKGLYLDHGGRYSALSRKTINTPIELAESVDARVLKMACEWFDNGWVWDCIKRRFDYLKKKQL